jgi:mannosyltransferase
LAVPVTLSYAISYSPLHLFSSRYLVIILPALFLLVGVGVSMFPWRLLQSLLAVGLAIFALLAVPLYYQSAQVEDWNVISHWLLEQYEPQDGLVCYDNELMQGCQISVEYYLQAYPGQAHFTADAPGAFSWTTYGPVNPKAGYAAALDPGVLAAYSAQHRRVFFIVGRVPNDQAAVHVRSTEKWLNSHYRLLHEMVTRTVTISLYQTR